jgi:hypothetical protein
MGLSVISFLLSLEVLWQVFQSNTINELFMVITFFALAFAHISLILLLKIESVTIRYVFYSTVIFIFLISIMLSALVLFHIEDEDLFLRLIGVVAILDVLGTISIPLLSIMIKRE